MLKKLKTIEDCNGYHIKLIGKENILALAKDGKCPHYILTNPANGENTYLFIPSELDDWVEQHITTINCVPEFTVKVIYNKVAEKSEIPIELSQIKNLMELPKEAAFAPSGVYFLCLEGVVKYVGQAVHVASRVASHYREGVKKFDACFYIPVGENDLDRTESIMIRVLNPEYNKKGGAILVEDNVNYEKTLALLTP